MSRFYEMSVEVPGMTPRRWPKSRRRRRRNGRLTTGGSPATRRGEADDARFRAELTLRRRERREFTERLSLAIWRANGSYCHVSVDATYLENLPYETHALDEADYARLIQGEHDSEHRRNPE